MAADVDPGTRDAERMRTGSAMLVAVGRLLTGTEHPVEARRSAALATLPFLGDVCVVDLDDAAHGGLGRATVVHHDPRDAHLAATLADRPPPPSVHAVFRQGSPVVHLPPRDLLGDDPALGRALMYPLVARGRPLGVVTFAARDPDHAFDEYAIGLGADVALRFALHADAARALDEAREARVRSEEARAQAETTLALERRTHQALQAALNRSRILAEVSGTLERSVDLEALDRVTALLSRWVADDVEIDIDTPHLGRRHARSTRTGGRPTTPARERAFPLGRRRRRLGTMTCRWWSTGPTAEESALLQEISERLTVTADAADLSAERIVTARTLQASLLPAVLPDVPGVALAGRYFPAYAGGEIGGDFYDVFPLGDGTWMGVVGDVCGKGVAAATMTAQARYTLRALAPGARSPAQLLRSVNDALVRQGTGDRFVTLAVTRIGPVGADGRARVEVACGGHPPPFVVRADGDHEIVPARGQLLGVLPEISVADVGVTLAPGDVLVAYTDGVTEADPHAPLDGTVIAASVAVQAARGPSGVALAVESLARGHAGGDELPDDLAILAMTLDP